MHLAISVAVGALVMLGYFTAGQEGEVNRALSALDVVISLVVTLVVIVTGIAGAFRVANRGEQLVTPVADPMANDGHRLVPAEVVQIAAAPTVQVTTSTEVPGTVEQMTAAPDWSFPAAQHGGGLGRRRDSER